MKERIMSGIQPTGNLHLGRYFGAIQNWVHLQEDYECYYCVVNYHAITMPYNPRKLRENSWDVVFNLLACGVKPEYLFIQSMVPEHTELGWILGAFCSYGYLSRMTQFKDKSIQSQETSKDSYISSALFTYPVLQAADILIYNAHKVPVGKDQEQHLELTRNIAQRFNQQTNSEYFNAPEALYTQFPKIMSTADPTIKMSASKGDKHNIDVFADPARIRKQIMSAITDSGELSEGQMSPGVENLFTLLRAAQQQDVHDNLMETYNNGNLQYGHLKQKVADAVIDYTEPIRIKRAELNANKKDIKNQIKSSGFNIRKKAAERLKEVKDLAGL
jgi:tryptophanyl-tRNA synthetase